MLGLGLPEIIIILIIAVFLFSGGDRLSEIGKGLGRFIGEFKKGQEGIDEDETGEPNKKAKDDKLAELGRGLGRATNEFKKSKEEVEKEIKKFKSDKN